MRKITLLVSLFVVVGAMSYFVFNVLAEDTPLPELEETEVNVETSKVNPTPPLDPNILLPDLVPLPAQDLTVVREVESGTTRILFSTTYYNRGTGPLELKADPETQGIRADHERKVFQRIYKKEGGYEDELVGTFEWHQEHLHYHYTDFVEYDLIPVNAPQHEDLAGSRIKSTFCIRDISTVDLDLPERKEEAQYKICGKETQGVSVGWGDTYYYNYPAQFLDVTGLESGTYRFVQKVNPASILTESNYENNVSSVLFTLNMEQGTLKVLGETPSDAPKVEHVHLDDPFGM